MPSAQSVVQLLRALSLQNSKSCKSCESCQNFNSENRSKSVSKNLAGPKKRKFPPFTFCKKLSKNVKNRQKLSKIKIQKLPKQVHFLPKPVQFLPKPYQKLSKHLHFLSEIFRNCCKSPPKTFISPYFSSPHVLPILPISLPILTHLDLPKIPAYSSVFFVFNFICFMRGR